MMCEAQNTANPDGFASILTKSQREILISKSDLGLNALAYGRDIQRAICNSRRRARVGITPTSPQISSLILS